MKQNSDMLNQVKDILLGKGSIILPEGLKVELVETIRAEFEKQKSELIKAFEKEKQELIEKFTLQLTIKDNEIARLKGRETNPENRKVSQ